MSVVLGHTAGLKASQLAALERLFRRRLPRASAAPVELVREVAGLAHDVRRRLGLLVDRAGEVTHVFVGDATTIELPPLEAGRRGSGRLRGLRWIVTAFGSDTPSSRDLSAFARARLDLLVLVAVADDGTAWSLREAHLLPAPDQADEADAARDASREGSRERRDDARHSPPHELSPPRAPHAARTDLEAFLQSLEDRHAAEIPATRATEGEGERVLLVAVGTGTKEELDRALAELGELARSAGALVVGELSQRRDKLDMRTLLGKGRVAELAGLCLERAAELVVIDQELAPAQAKALEESLPEKVKVIDRTQLILDVFAQRARTRAGKLAVETARLRYLAPRLAGQWVGFSRLRGGIGGNRGVGETRLELDRRAIRRRIQHLESELGRVGRHRAVNRSRRLKGTLPHVAIVGYTNVGKSTLFNRITDSKVSAEDRPFDTLDPTVRRRRLPSGRVALFSDTVGFMRDLPAGLLQAFAATLEELRDARLLVHVADASDPHVFERIEQVRSILASLGLAGPRELLVYNKRDRLERPELFLPLARAAEAKPLLLSALADETESVVVAVDEALAALEAESGTRDPLADEDEALPEDPIA